MLLAALDVKDRTRVSWCAAVLHFQLVFWKLCFSIDWLLNISQFFCISLFSFLLFSALSRCGFRYFFVSKKFRSLQSSGVNEVTSPVKLDHSGIGFLASPRLLYRATAKRHGVYKSFEGRNWLGAFSDCQVQCRSIAHFGGGIIFTKSSLRLQATHQKPREWTFLAADVIKFTGFSLGQALSDMLFPGVPICFAFLMRVL